VTLALAIGTCRVLEPTKLMRAAGCSARISIHRVHTTGEILSLLAAIKTEGRNSFDHLLSDRAFGEIVVKGSDVVARDRVRLRDQWPKVDRLLIEVCSRRDYRPKSGKPVVGALVERQMRKHSDALERAIETGRIAALRADDLRPHTMKDVDLIAGMRRISEQAEGRPITWVSHAIPSDLSSEYDHVRTIRTELAENLEEGAKVAGGRFFNPSQIVAELGQSNAFRQGGRDTAHFTNSALSVLADEYARLLGLKAHAARRSASVAQSSLPARS
jgi:hypothetical protein